MAEGETQEDLFELAAKYYGYRTPYAPSFFKAVGERSGLSGNSNILDLCTGRGEVANGLAPYAGSVTAVDISQAMLRHAPANAKIDYVHIDVNSAEFLDRFRNRRFSHITAGRSFHWVNDDIISALGQTNLLEGGSIIALTSRFTGKNSWRPAYLDILRKYGSGRTMVNDYVATGRMQKLGFHSSDQIDMRFQARIGTETLLGEMLSRSLTTEQLDNNRHLLLEEINQNLAPFLTDGKLDAYFACSAEIFTRGSR